MAKLIIIAMGVSFMGADVAIGTEIELSDKSAAALIAEGLAEVVVTAEVTDPPAGGGQEPTEEEKQAAALAAKYAEAEKQAAALDAQYKRDELYEAAKAVGVDIAFDAKKADIIAAVIAQGFAIALIK